MIKEGMGCAPAELTLGITLRLWGLFIHPNSDNLTTFSEAIAAQLKDLQLHILIIISLLVFYFIYLFIFIL